MGDIPPTESWKLVRETVETEISRLNKLGAEAFGSGDLDRVDRLAAEVRSLQSGLAALRRLQSKIEDLAAKSQPGLTVQRKSRGAEKADLGLVVEGHAALEQPEASVQPAEAEPPTLQHRRTRTKRALSQYTKDVEALIAEPDWTVGQWAQSKELVCRGRALMTEADMVGMGAESPVGLVDSIGRKMRELDPESTFFGLNMSRSEPVQVWSQIADSLALFPAAYDAVAWLETEPAIEEERFKELLLGASAIETWFYRLMDVHGMRAWDEQQRELNSRVRAISEAKQIYVPWWNRDPKHFIETTVVAQSAQALSKVYKLIHDSAAKTSAKAAAGSALDKVLDSNSENADFAVDLIASLESTFDAGLPPSDRNLRSRLAPYRAYLEDSTHPQVRKLAAYLSQDANKAFASGKTATEVEPETPDDQEFERMLGIVRRELEGKVVLFIGGNKGQSWRSTQYKQELGLADLIWPDAEDKTKPGSFRNDIERADLAVLLIRWSRHSFKSVLDEAKAAGKPTITLTRGLGLNTFVLAYLEQIGESQVAKRN